MILFKMADGKTVINVDQIVSAHKDKSGDFWTLFMTDDKRYDVTKHEWSQIEALSGTMSGGNPNPVPCPTPCPKHFTISLQGVIESDES